MAKIKKLKIGIAGCGAIGTSLAKIISRRFPRQAEITGLYDLDFKKSGRLSRIITGKNNLVAADLNRLIARASLVIESASSSSSLGIAKEVLSKKRDIMIMSAGGVVNNFRQLLKLAADNNLKIYIPSGAIAGIDALKAAKMGKINQVTLTTRKNPVSFKGVEFIENKKIRLNDLKKDKVLFSGSAESAVKYFPQNINIAAVLSLAGVGRAKTKVRVIASPGIKRNIHEIEIKAGCGRIFTRTENVLHPDNPKTSYLAALSALAALKQILVPEKLGT